MRRLFLALKPPESLAESVRRLRGSWPGILKMSFARSSPFQVFPQPLGEDGEELRIELLGEPPVF